MEKKYCQILSVFAVFLFFTTEALAAVHQADSISSKCTWMTNGLPYGYCIHKTKGSKNPDILYFFHGAGGNQMAWKNTKKTIWGYWRDHKIDAPTVVSFSFGPIWLLAHRNTSGASGLLEFVTNTMMPKVEAELGFKEGRRLLVGESMGGFNAAELVLKRPDLFARAAIMCADLTPLTPFSSDKEMNDFMNQTGADYNHTWWEVFMEKIFYGDVASWNQDAPLLIANKLLNSHTPPLYISGGTADEYGFYPGDKQFAEIAQASGVSVVWDSLEGKKHCAYSPTTIANFILQ